MSATLRMIRTKWITTNVALQHYHSSREQQLFRHQQRSNTKGQTETDAEFNPRKVPGQNSKCRR
jgi:hypothetical protein